MKRLFNPQIITAVLFAFTLMLTSCSGDDDNSIITPPDGKDSIKPTKDIIIITPENAQTDERKIKITANPSSLVTVRVNFKSTDNMSRLYITKNEYGTNNVLYNIPSTTTKKDGSIDVKNEKDRKNITFDIPFLAPETKNGTVVYTLWMTKTKGFTSRGDFRNPSKRNAISEEPAAVGTVIIEAGNGSSLNGKDINSFSAVILAAPLGDGSSDTFISIFNGTKYKIIDGEEYASFWDFGYFYGATKKASFASAANYPTDIINIPKIAANESITEEDVKGDLNHFYIAKSSMNFENINSFDELSKIKKPSTERVTNLVKNDVLEFVDQFGNKGLIKITDVNAGNGGKGKITFDVKVQQNVIDPFKD